MHDPYHPVADAAMQEGEVPDQVREAVTSEADALREQFIAQPAGLEHRPAPTGGATFGDIVDVEELARQLDEQAPPAN